MHSLCTHRTVHCVHTLPKPDDIRRGSFRSFRWLSANRRELHIQTIFNFMCKMQLCAPPPHNEWIERTGPAASPNLFILVCCKSAVFIRPHFYLGTLKVWRQSRRLRKVLPNARARFVRPYIDHSCLTFVNYLLLLCVHGGGDDAVHTLFTLHSGLSTHLWTGFSVHENIFHWSTQNSRTSCMWLMNP